MVDKSDEVITVGRTGVGEERWGLGPLGSTVIYLTGEHSGPSVHTLTHTHTQHVNTSTYVH